MGLLIFCLFVFVVVFFFFFFFFFYKNLHATMNSPFGNVRGNGGEEQ